MKRYLPGFENMPADQLVIHASLNIPSGSTIAPDRIELMENLLMRRQDEFSGIPEKRFIGFPDPDMPGEDVFVIALVGKRKRA